MPDRENDTSQVLIGSSLDAPDVRRVRAFTPPEVRDAIVAKANRCRFPGCACTYPSPNRPARWVDGYCPGHAHA